MYLITNKYKLLVFKQLFNLGVYKEKVEIILPTILIVFFLMCKNGSKLIFTGRKKYYI